MPSVKFRLSGHANLNEHAFFWGAYMVSISDILEAGIYIGINFDLMELPLLDFQYHFH